MTTLHTSRLTLRPHRPEDFDELRTLWADTDVVRFIGGRAASDEESWARLLRYAGLWSLLGYGYWAARETSTGRYVGDFGFADFHRDIDPPFEGVPEAGWAMMPWAQGQGLAQEALTAMLGWADETLGAGRTVCLISPENAPSIRLAERVGFRAYRDTSYKGSATRLFERRRA